RRPPVMAGLATGRPILTTSGALTEIVWTTTAAVAVAPASDPEAFHRTALELLRDRAHLATLAAGGEAVYRSQFALEHTINVLRDRRGAGAAWAVSPWPPAAPHAICPPRPTDAPRPVRAS